MQRARLVPLLCVLLVVACTGCTVDSYGILTADCGDGTPTDSYFVTVASGKQHSCAVQHPLRNVSCWPPDHAAALYTPQFVRDVHALSSAAQYSCAVWGDKRQLTCWGTLVGRDKNLSAVDMVYNITRGVRMLAASSPSAQHTCFLRESNNDVSCFGENNKRQLGFDTGGAPISPLIIRAD